MARKHSLSLTDLDREEDELRERIAEIGHVRKFLLRKSATSVSTEKSSSEPASGLTATLEALLNSELGQWLSTKVIIERLRGTGLDAQVGHAFDQVVRSTLNRGKQIGRWVGKKEGREALWSAKEPEA